MAIVNYFLAEPALDNIIGKLIQLLYEGIGNFGWTVVIFTVILRTVLLPVDIWQKRVMIKNNRIMKKIKPQLEKLQKQYAGNREMYGAKQMELYKKEGYSLFGACLPMIVTLAVFWIVFSGFYATVRYRNEMITYELAELYNEGARDEELADAYGENIESWLWIKNVYMPDTMWADIVPSKKVYTGSKLGQLRAQMPENFNEMGDYNTLVGPAIEKYNKKDWKDTGGWNGYMILPLLAVLLNFATTILMKNSQPVQPAPMGADGNPMNNQSMKMMQYMMPFLIGVFSLFYSSAFTIYLFFSALYSGIFNLIFNKINAKAEQKLESAASSYRR
ncbi:MAG: YidC/Oxa1 family membrane protein insertase [Christensenellales bacterium]|jgi:YidC/Oxa1 family membrane protein insertase